MGFVRHDVEQPHEVGLAHREPAGDHRACILQHPEPAGQADAGQQQPVQPPRLFGRAGQPRVVLEPGVAAEFVRQRPACQRGGVSRQHVRGVDVGVAARGEQVVQARLRAAVGQPEHGRQPLVPVQRLAEVDAFGQRRAAAGDDRDGVRALGEAAAEAQQPAVVQHLVQGRPGIERGLLDALGELQCGIVDGFFQGIGLRYRRRACAGFTRRGRACILAPKRVGERLRTAPDTCGGTR